MDINGQVVKRGKGFKISAGSEVTILFSLILISIVFSLLTDHFFSFSNFINILIYSAIIGISATGATLGLIQGNIDISIGSVMGASGMLCSLLLKNGTSVIVAVSACLILGLVFGAINGLLVSIGKINSIIATLATMSIFRGIAYLSNNGNSIVINDSNFKWIGRGFVGPIPFIVLLMLGFFILIWYVSKYTAFGRSIYATGSNLRASYLSGIKTIKIVFSVYVISGIMASVSGVLMASQAGAGLPTAGIGYEMTVISACVLGGTSLTGGKGSIWGSFIGVVLLTTISNGLTMLSVQSFYQQIIKGLILLIAVFIDVIRSGGYKKI